MDSFQHSISLLQAGHCHELSEDHRVICTVKDDLSLFQSINKWGYTCAIQFLSSCGVHSAYTEEVVKAQTLQQNCPLTSLCAMISKREFVYNFPRENLQLSSIRVASGEPLDIVHKEVGLLMNINGSGCSIIKSHLC
jgi:hypothetical protein